jgi:malate dehydrogenase (oxaloacetate-decarboxylating)
MNEPLKPAEQAAQAHYEEAFDTRLSLLDPMLNKGTAFTEEERDALDLHGLLPPHVSTLDSQLARRLAAFRACGSDLDKYIFLRDLQDTNETLFYALLTRHIEEMLPIVYTPTVGLGCEQFSTIFRKPRGLFISYPHRDRIRRMLAPSRFDNIEAIVVTDGSRILGLGDQGAGGMGIPIGKLSLYTACGGLHPATTLPIFLDAGTDNEERLNDPQYIGWRHRRVAADEYDAFVESFVSAVQERWPHVLLQWEDFAQANANRILARYRERLCTFNDDIQGTAVVTVGTLLAAINVTGVPLAEQRIAVLGAGSAGCGISALLMKAMIADGLPEAEARQRFYLVDREGLLFDDTPNLQSFQQPFAQARTATADWKLESGERIGLQEVADNARISVLIGVSGQGGAFTESAVRSIARHCRRPVIFPLSNPTTRSEARPADLLDWTDGLAVIGTGSPFAPVEFDGRRIAIDQTNNAYIFPGIGLGVIATQARHVSEDMLLAAARTLADISPTRKDTNLSLLPPVDQLREVSIKIALAVARQAQVEGLADSCDEAALKQRIEAKMWTPAYRRDPRLG